MKGLAVLGSTGTIGQNTLAVVDKFPEEFQVLTLAAGKNTVLLRDQIQKYRPKMVSTGMVSEIPSLRSEFPGIDFLSNADACATAPGVEIVMMGIVGFAALSPTFSAVRAGKRIALASKEVLVVAGELLNAELKKSGATLIPVDSEHNALFQLLEKQDRKEVSSLVLTASGGPLFRVPEMPLETVTPALACKHPNWKMGPKISVDSATLMNKGLEVIEAHFLFGFSSQQIEIWIHPQSILHGALLLKDGSCLAQLSTPDMKSSIAYAMNYPERCEGVVSQLKFAELAKLEFFPPDETRFPALRLCREALKGGASSLIVLNAANEVAVEAFLNKKISFPQIRKTIERVLEGHSPFTIPDLETVIEVDREVRRKLLAL